MIELTAIVPKRAFQVPVARREIERLLEDEVRAIGDLYAKVYATWNSPPTPHKEVRIGSADAYGEVAFTDDKMFWLDEGTSVCYAVPSRDWISKTSVGWIGSRPGRGRIVARGRKYGANRKIDARHWSDIIAQRRERPFQAAAGSAMARIAHVF